MKILDRENSLILKAMDSIKDLEKYIGTNGYFTDNLDDTILFSDGTLEDIILGSYLPFVDINSCRYAYFIPKAVFKEIEESTDVYPITDIVDRAKAEGSLIDFQNDKYSLSTDGHTIWDYTHKCWLDHRDYAKLVASKSVFVITNVEV